MSSVLSAETSSSTKMEILDLEVITPGVAAAQLEVFRFWKMYRLPVQEVELRPM